MHTEDLFRHESPSAKKTVLELTTDWQSAETLLSTLCVPNLFRRIFTFTRHFRTDRVRSGDVYFPSLLSVSEMFVHLPLFDQRFRFRPLFYYGVGLIII